MVHEGGVTLHQIHKGEWYFRTMHGKVVTEPVREDTDDAPRGAFAMLELEAWFAEIESRVIREPVPI